jgi:hypothetical protein
MEPRPNTHRPRIAGLLLALLALWTCAGAMVASAPAGALGTGSMRGRFTSSRTGLPIAHAFVILRTPDADLQTAVSDADGRYRIDGISFGDHAFNTFVPCQQGGQTSISVDGDEVLDFEIDDSTPFDEFGHACRQGSSGMLAPSNPTALPLNGDDQEAAVALPFAFPYYGSTKTSMRVSTNGYLTFGADSGVARANTFLDFDESPRDSIFPFWDDLLMDQQSSIKTGLTTLSGKQVFVVEWRNMAFFGDAAAGRLSFQVQLFKGGEIRMAYGPVDPLPRPQGTSATLGIKGAGNDAVTLSFESSAVSSGLTVRWVTDQPPVANAGPDKKVASGKAFTLDGVVTDPDGPDGLRVRWTQFNGPATTIQDSNKAIATVAGQKGPKTMTYQLTVEDQFGRFSQDEVVVTVTAPK